MSEPPHPFDALLHLMDRLRDPGGCPWDREQDLATLKPYLIEEAYEVLEAIDSGDRGRLRDELGDLLFQIVFQARIAREEGAFDAGDVCRAIVAKMQRRHPHVFGDAEVDSVRAVRARWERLKAAEGEAEGRPRRVLSGVPAHLPALLRAHRMAEKAGTVGFDWPDRAAIEGKIDEEWRELHDALDAGTPAEIAHEYGDLLFAMASFGRFIGVNPEDALRQAGNRFAARFGHIEDRLAEQGRAPHEATLEEMDAFWDEAKRLFSAAPG